MLVSPADMVVQAGDRTCTLGRLELQDLGRAFAGALFVSLPLLYTQEMWSIGLVLNPWVLLTWLGIGYLLCVGYFAFAGFRADRPSQNIWMDAAVAIGIGTLASAITLLLVGRWDPSDAGENIVRLILLESVPTAIGAAVAVNQLGGGDAAGDRSHASKWQPDLKFVIASLLGAVLFVVNIAPTVETQIIAYSITWWHALALVVFSLAVTHITTAVVRIETDEPSYVVLTSPWVQTAVGYLLALFASYVMLSLYGYITSGIPLPLQVMWVVVLSYGTALAGAAGRVVL